MITFKVKSDTSDTHYTIKINEDSGLVTCSCPAFRFQEDTDESLRTCKHINKVATHLINKVAVAIHNDSPYATRGLDNLSTSL